VQGLKAELLRGFWYVAMPGGELAPGATAVRVMLGDQILLARRKNGTVFAINDICPHRGMPLHHGRFDGERVACIYHGWQYGSDGTCAFIPSAMDDQKIDIAKIRTAAYPCVEQQGLVWVYFARDGEAPAGEMAKPPMMPLFAADAAPKVHVEQTFPCSVDHAAFGLMDPGHIAFVHTSKWYRSKVGVVKPKQKSFEPSELGFRMMRHKVTAQNLLYRLLGREVTTEISYRLPGLRIEDINGERNAVVTVSALTPISDEETAFHQIIWATPKWANLVKPIVRYVANVFVGQDRAIAEKQREGLLRAPKTMLINDVNTQARWWMRLKDEWVAAANEGRDFVNPIKAATLRWKS
jgi:phenylpropionate dioxygenase-like ring-hydroxylating dioxygenase large terminal subunit